MTSDGDEASFAGRTVGHFRVQERLGAGGMGVVYRASDTRLRRDVALKFLPRQGRAPEALERFIREARAASTLGHPNVCTVFDVGEFEGEPFIAMELLRGETLKDRLVRGALPATTIASLGVQIADALEAAHRHGILHRDLKPANIFVTERGDAKVLDFGLATRLDESGTGAPGDFTGTASADLTRSGVLLGTLVYMSPEQARGESLDGRSDVFSLGAVLYEMATGRRPFAGASSADVVASILHAEPQRPSTANPAVSAELDAIIQRALRKDKSERYPSAAALQSDLERLRHASHGSEHVATRSLPHAPPRGRHTTTWVAVAAALAVGALGVAHGVRLPPDARVARLTLLSSSQATRRDWALAAGRIYYFMKSSDSGKQLLQGSTAGGNPIVIPQPLGEITILDISADGAQLLVLQDQGYSKEGLLFLLPIPSGSPRRIGDVSAKDAALSWDGRRLVYVHEDGLYEAAIDGSGTRRLVAGPEVKLDPVLSHDGRRIRYRQAAPGSAGVWSLWEVPVAGGTPTRLYPGFDDVRCGAFTADGRYFVFTSTEAGEERVWAVPQAAFGREGRPALLTTVPLSSVCAIPNKSESALMLAGDQLQARVLRFDAPTRRWELFLGGLSAENVSFSRDGQWVAYVTYPEGELWRSRIDGSEKLRLTGAERALLVKWSPDGHELSFVTRRPDAALFTLPATGGTPRALPMGEARTLAHAWSPDGSQMVLGEWLTKAPVLRLLDVKSGQVSILPGSEGLIYPIWSRDGKWIAASAQHLPKQGVWLYDVARRDWKKLPLPLEALNYWAWSEDSRWIYFDGPVTGPTEVRRMHIPDGALEDVASLKGVNRVAGAFGRWFGLAPGDVPLVLDNVGTRQIYQLTLDTP